MDAEAEQYESEQYAREQSPPDEGYFHEHTYAELAGGV